MQEEGGAFTWPLETPPGRGRAIPLSQPPQKKTKPARDLTSPARSRTVPSKATRTTRSRQSTPRRSVQSSASPSSASRSARAATSTPNARTGTGSRATRLNQPPKETPHAPIASESATQAFRKYPAVANVKRCPAGRVYIAPNQREKAYYQFIVCIADDEHANVKRHELTREHARCFYCLSCDEEIPILKGKSKVGPHMMKKHSDALRAYEENIRRENALNASTNLIIPVAASGESEQRAFETILAEWVSQDMRPASIVGDPGFIKAITFANRAQNTLSIPSRQTVTLRIHAQASEARLSLRATLANGEECDFFSASSDIWTSMKSESFISFTIHYVDACFNMNSWTLEVRHIPGKHDGDSIAGALLDCFSWWRLDPMKCVRFLRDGAANIVKACRKLGVSHRSCAAHSLHLVVAAALLMKSNERGDNVAIDADGNLLNSADGPTATRAEDVARYLATGRAFSWINDRLQELEDDVEDDGELDDFVTDAEIDTIATQVATFVANVEDVERTEVNAVDMESARKSVRTFRKLADYFHRSQKGSNRLEKLQSSKKHALQVLIDCPTRWNSTLLMLQRFVELKTAIDDFFSYLKTPKGVKEFDDVASKKLAQPSAEQWFTIQCLIELLAPFSVATKKLDGETYPTLVSLHIVISSLKIMLRNEGIFDLLYAKVEQEPFALSVLSTMQSVRRSFLALLTERFSKDKDDDLLWISLLDPYMTNSPLLTDDEFETAKANLIREMIPIMKAKLAPVSCGPESPPSSPDEMPNDPIARASLDIDKLLYAKRLDTQAVATDQKILSACETEFVNYVRTSYEAEVIIGQKSSPSALKWWKENHAAFPTIAPIARKWLGCIATSVPSERAFSTAGNVVTKRRSALKSSTIRDILFMAENVAP